MDDIKKELEKISSYIASSKRSHWLAGCGGIFSATISVLINQSFWWAILHTMFGWVYVIYAFTVRHEATVAGIRRLIGFFK